jgi:DNA-binding YbaB/EbfC family protein
MSKKMLGDLMKQAQKMQEQMGKVQEESKKKTIEAAAGGGMVVATVSGAMELVSLKIEKDVVNPEDIEMLQDLVVAAVNEALRRAQQMVSEDMGKITGGMNIPGMGNPFG